MNEHRLRELIHDLFLPLPFTEHAGLDVHLHPSLILAAVDPANTLIGWAVMREWGVKVARSKLPS
jgi:hypothetical protein